MIKEEKLILTTEYEVLEYQHGNTTGLKELLEFFGFDDNITNIKKINNSNIFITTEDKEYWINDGDFLLKDQACRIKHMTPTEYEEFVKECNLQPNEKRKIQRNQLEKTLYNNFYDKEKEWIDLSGLDFSNYHCRVNISHMKVDGKLYQNYQDVKSLEQGDQKVKGHLDQSDQIVENDLFQGNQKVNGNLYQNFQEVNGDLQQCSHVVEGDLYNQQDKSIVKGKIIYE